jgi:type II secretory pathway component GspD/PulD (secretin)
MIEEKINELKNANLGQTQRSAPTKNNVGVNLCVHPEIKINTKIDLQINC